MPKLVLLFLASLSLLAGDTKQPKKPPKPAEVLWTYETPRGFQLLEPSYRYPTQVKAALLRYVQPVPALSREYHQVFLDKHKLATWLKGVLAGERVRRAQAAKAHGAEFGSLKNVRGGRHHHQHRQAPAEAGRRPGNH